MDMGGGTLRREIRPVYRLCLKTKYLPRNAPRNTVRFFISRRSLNENAEIQTNAVAVSCDADVRYHAVWHTNTPKNASADINIIEKLWKKRFGIDATALDRALLFLQKPYDWVDSNNGKKFYKYAPEFTLEDIQAEDGRDGYEFYLFNQCDSRPRWYDINIYHHQTLLYSLGGVALDGGRCFTSTPRTDGLSLYKDSYHHWDVSYKYFIKDSIEYTIHQFYITDNMDEELTARQRFLECVLIFETEFERTKFNAFVIGNYERYNIDAFSDRLPHFPDLEGYNMDAFKKDYLQSQLLQQMLKDFRS